MYAASAVYICCVRQRDILPKLDKGDSVVWI